MSKFYCLTAILVVLVASQQTSAIWFFRPFNFIPITYPTTTTTTTTTTAAPVTDTTTTEATTTVSTTPTPVQISAGFVTSQVFNNTGGTGYFPQQHYPPFGGNFPLGGGFGGVAKPANSGGGYPTIGGLARPLFSGLFGGLRPFGSSYGGGYPVIGGVASPNGK